MSSNFSGVVTVVQEPEALELGGKKCTKLRMVDKAISKKHEDRFFNGIFHGFDGDTGLRLGKGDKIHVTGTLGLTSYFSKKTKQKVQADELGFGSRILQVIVSPSFFGDKPAPAVEAEDVEPETTPAGKGPLDDLDL